MIGSTVLISLTIRKLAINCGKPLGALLSLTVRHLAKQDAFLFSHSFTEFENVDHR